MSGIITNNQLALVVSSVVLLGVTLFFKRHANAARQEKREWKHVGKLSDLLCFPIKSCGSIRLMESECSKLGLKKLYIRDRVFMVVNCEGNFVTGRTLPKLVQIQPLVDGSILTLRAEGVPDIKVDMSMLFNLPKSTTSVWGQKVQTVDCGDDVANWLTRVLLNGEEPGLRLVFYPESEPSRNVKPQNKIFDKCNPHNVGALTDATSYSLISQTSVDDLNTRLEKSVTAAQFRNNFLIECNSDVKPYEEDGWDLIRIGTVTFRNIKPCTRCLFTTVDPYTAHKDVQQEPLKTLKSYRKITEPNLVPYTGDSPVLGIHLGLQDPSGFIQVGDDVYVI